LKRLDRNVLQKMTALTALNLSDNELRMFPGVTNLTALRHLDVSENCLNSLEFVEDMPHLEDLRVEGNGLKVDLCMILLLVCWLTTNYHRDSVSIT